jgi:hypothetical protein
MFQLGKTASTSQRGIEQRDRQDDKAEQKISRCRNLGGHELRADSLQHRGSVVGWWVVC